MPITKAFLDDRIAAAKKEIVALEAAILAVAGGMQQYTLDTGQTRQTVTKANLGSMRLQLDSALNRLSMLCQRRDGTSTFNARGVGRARFGQGRRI